MANEYIAAATGKSEGSLFTLSAGSSRMFYCDPALDVGESVVAQITNDSGTTWFDVGLLCDPSKQVGTLTATGAGSSSFRCILNTKTDKALWYD